MSDTIKKAFCLAAGELSAEAEPQFAKLGEIQPFTESERDGLVAARDWIVRYAEEPAPEKPLCLAVFGSPGSGKSFVAKEIVKTAAEQLKGKGKKLEQKLPFSTINITQFAGPAEVAGALVGRVAGPERGTLPVVFFDEFDAQRNGISWGWLSWFLAPMNDGVFVLNGADVSCRRAVFLFAGGTADSFKDFCNPRDIAGFRLAKGPDFISRLGGHLDVMSPNDRPREWRRAALFADLLERERPEIQSLEDDLVKSMVGVGRYRHGTRSVRVLLETCGTPEAGEKLRHSDLPAQQFLDLHVDRGPLDPVRAGGLIGLSGGGPTHEQLRDLAQRVGEGAVTVARQCRESGLEHAVIGKLSDLIVARAVRCRW
ncbi:MAG: ATP-binding protein [Pseudomonadota bacterium]